MTDLNFFENYTGNPKIKEKIKLILYIFLALFFIIVLSYPIYNFITIYNIERNIKDMKEFLESSDVLEKFRRLEEKKVKVENIKNQLLAIENIQKVIQDVDIINEALIYNIFSTIPQNLYFESMNVSSDNITIQGNSKDKTSIAELECNLSKLHIFKDIFISSIILKDNNYIFVIQLKL